MSGTVISVHIASEPGGPLVTLTEATLVPGKGIPGDRNYRPEGAAPHRQITLIEEEKVAEFNRQTGLAMQPGMTRRNVVTRGVNLNQLIGKRFQLGETVLEGVELCQPCAGLGALHASGQVSQAQVVREMVDRGGLRARIVTGGTIKPGDPISEQE